MKVEHKNHCTIEHKPRDDNNIKLIKLLAKVCKNSIQHLQL